MRVLSGKAKELLLEFDKAKGHILLLSGTRVKGKELKMFKGDMGCFTVERKDSKLKLGERKGREIVTMVLL